MRIGTITEARHMDLTPKYLREEYIQQP